MAARKIPEQKTSSEIGLRIIINFQDSDSRRRFYREWGDAPFTRAVAGGAMSDVDRPLAGRCHAATVRALLEHDPALRLPDTFNGRLALWWARFHGCEDVLKLVS